MNVGDRRRKIVIASVLGVIVLAVLAKVVLGGGGGSDLSSPITFPTSTGKDATTTSASERSTETPATFDVFATKNPFEPVIIVTPDGGGSTDTTTPGSTDTTPDGTGTTPPDGSGGTGGTGESTTTTSPPSVEPSPGTSVALLDVFTSSGTTKAKVQVGSTVYTVGEGETFATSYQVVSLDAPCGQFLFGDAPFKLCEGEEVIK